MPYLESSIEIAAPPAKVREVLLNFEAIPQWHTKWLKSIQVVDKSKTPQALVPGDKVECQIESYNFVAEIKENSETLLSWQGPPVITIAGLHKFCMEPIQDGAATRFTQSENLTGLLSFLMHRSIFGRMMQSDYDGFNKDLKARAEAS